MSLDSYVSAFRDASEPPTRLRGLAEDEQPYSSDEEVSTSDLARFERAAAEAEALTDEFSTANLAQRSMLVGAAQVELRLASDLLMLDEAIEAEGGRRALGSADGGFISSDMAQMLEDLQAVAEGPPDGDGGGSGGAVAGTLDEKDLKASFEEHVKAILKTGDGALKDLAGTVGWTAVGNSASHVFGKVIQYLPSPESLTEGLGRIKRLAVRLIASGIDKVVKIIGSERLEKLVEDMKKRLGTAIDEGLVGTLLGKLFSADQTAPACVELVKQAGGSEPQQEAALRAAKGVADHAAKLAGMSDKATKVLGLIPGLWASPIGLYVAIGVVVAMGGVVWQVQDHLDSAEPVALPDLTDGMMSRVRNSLV